jgi:hypothetical protein
LSGIALPICGGRGRARRVCSARLHSRGIDSVREVLPVCGRLDCGLGRGRAICSANLHSRIVDSVRRDPATFRGGGAKLGRPVPHPRKVVAPDALCLADHPASARPGRRVDPSCRRMILDTLGTLDHFRHLHGEGSTVGWGEAGQSVRQICIVASLDSVRRDPATFRGGGAKLGRPVPHPRKVVAPHALCLADHPACVRG